ncbi:DHH family phosphoesterase [Tepidibacillus fermentans]|uniref:Phosphoesterase RecJ-like protein n=1 Tax=Tepidibacillus fermentans TaxID=1281767 RepID=A0A4R3KIA9_9BACI|nr:bifunctional oligoribonuclease/PAP phosphatase NrnA [Tepidibacillus fermentans]TCS82986.1 phosphoesterase RecJ-like protein [Tepidibacillus fermentans]
MNDYKEQLTEAARFIHQNDNFLIVSHVNPDGDTISSSLALAHLLKDLGKSFHLVNQDEIPKRFQFLPLADQIQIMTHMSEKFSAIISVDVADRSRMGAIDSLMYDHTKILNIDHHPTNDHFGDVNLVLPTAAATAEVMYDLAHQLQVHFHRDLATCIYTGLLTDTGGFRYANTSAKVMRIAAELLEYGVSPSKIAEITLETITPGHIQILKIALSKLEIIEDGKIAWTFLEKKDLPAKTLHDETEGIVNYCRNIEGVEVGVFFKETDDQVIKVSLRSKNIIDVGAIAKSFGGGGHARAAGYTFHGSLEEAKSILRHKITKDEGWNHLGNEF